MLLGSCSDGLKISKVSVGKFLIGKVMDKLSQNK